MALLAIVFGSAQTRQYHILVLESVSVSILSTREFGGKSLRFGRKPFFPQNAMTPLLRKKGVPAKITIPKCTNRVFLWYRFGKNREIPTEYQPKKLNRYPTLILQNRMLSSIL